MKLETVGEAGVQGWRGTVADKGAQVVSRRTPLRYEHARALFGIAFLALSLLYVSRAIAQLVRAARS